MKSGIAVEPAWRAPVDFRPLNRGQPAIRTRFANRTFGRMAMPLPVGVSIVGKNIPRKPKKNSYGGIGRQGRRPAGAAAGDEGKGPPRRAH